MLPAADVRMEYYKNLPVAVITFDRQMEILSSCIYNGGMKVSDTIAIMQVPSDYMCEDPVVDVLDMLSFLSLPDMTVVFMTAAEVDHVISDVKISYKGNDARAICTAGLSNQVIAGDELVDWEKRHAISEKRRQALLKHAGTINVIGISDVPLTDNAKVNSFIAMTEAKTAALQDLGWKETGTTSDAIAIVSPIGGDRCSYCGTGFGLGVSLARAVRGCVRSCLIKRGDFPYDMGEDEIAKLKEKFA